MRALDGKVRKNQKSGPGFADKEDARSCNPGVLVSWKLDAAVDFAFCPGPVQAQDMVGPGLTRPQGVEDSFEEAKAQGLMPVQEVGCKEVFRTFDADLALFGPVGLIDVGQGPEVGRGF